MKIPKIKIDKVCNKYKTKHHPNSATWKSSDWVAQAWDARLGAKGAPKRFQYPAALTLEEVEAQSANDFAAHFGKTLDTVQLEKKLKGEPRISDLIALYHEVCALLPSATVRKANVADLMQMLTQTGSPNPEREYVKVLRSSLVDSWFAKRVQHRSKAKRGDVNEINREKRTLKSKWDNIKSLFKPKMRIAMKERGYSEDLIRQLKDFREDVDTAAISAPIGQDDFVPVTDELIEQTMAEFKALKFKDPNAYIVFLLGIGAGLRSTEAIHVRWEDLGDGFVMALPHGEYNTKGKRTRKALCPQFIIDEIREFEHLDKSGEFAQYCVSHNTPKRTITIVRDAYTGKAPKRKKGKGIGRGQVTGQYKAVRRKRSEWTQEVGGKPCTKTERGEIKANNSVKNRVNAILAKLGWNEVGLTTSGKKFHKLRGWNVTQVIENEGLKAGSVHAGHRSTKTTSAWYHLPAAEQDKEYIANKLLR